MEVTMGFCVLLNAIEIYLLLNSLGNRLEPSWCSGTAFVSKLDNCGSLFRRMLMIIYFNYFQFLDQIDRSDTRSTSPYAMSKTGQKNLNIRFPLLAIHEIKHETTFFHFLKKIQIKLFLFKRLNYLNYYY